MPRADRLPSRLWHRYRRSNGPSAAASWCHRGAMCWLRTAHSTSVLLLDGAADMTLSKAA